MTLTEIRAAVIEALAPPISAVVRRRDILTHRGQFMDLQEIHRIAMRSPTVLVAIRGVQNAERRHDTLVGTVLFVAYTVTRDRQGIARDEMGHVLVTPLADHIAAHGNTWPFAEDYPERINAVNVSTQPIDRDGTAVWELSWTQRCRITEVGMDALLSDFDGYDANHYRPEAADTDPAAADHVTFEEI